MGLMAVQNEVLNSDYWDY